YRRAGRGLYRSLIDDADPGRPGEKGSSLPDSQRLRGAVDQVLELKAAVADEHAVAVGWVFADVPERAIATDVAVGRGIDNRVAVQLVDRENARLQIGRACVDREFGDADGRRLLPGRRGCKVDLLVERVLLHIGEQVCRPTPTGPIRREKRLQIG